MTLAAQARALGWDGARIARELDFRVCDLGIRCILLRADRDLHDLAWALRDAEAATEVGHWIARSDAALRRLRVDDGSFRSLDLRTGKLSPAITSATFLPLYACAVDGDAANALAEMFERLMTKVTFALPSTDPDFAGSTRSATGAGRSACDESHDRRRLCCVRFFRHRRPHS